jgi:hypothetical protein
MEIFYRHCKGSTQFLVCWVLARGMLECDERTSWGLPELYLLQQRIGKELELACFLRAIAGMLPHSRVAQRVLDSVFSLGWVFQVLLHTVKDRT